MIFLVPLFLWIGTAAAAVVVALHFIVTHQPKAEAFPTARFVPESPVQAVSNTTRPTDLLLLLLRVFAVLCIAAALARPVLTSARNPLARIFLADVSDAAKNPNDVRDSVRRYFQKGDVLISLGSKPQLIAEPDSLSRKAGFSGNPSLSAGLITAIRSAATLRERADSISLVFVSALPEQSWDAVTDTIRSLWPGSVKVVRLVPRSDSATPKLASVRTTWIDDDPLRYSVALAAKTTGLASVQIVRQGIAAVSGGATIHWPVMERPQFSQAVSAKSYSALVVGDVVVVAPFKTSWDFPPDSLRGAKVWARWSDGTPAAIQHDTPSGCIRSVNIPVPSRGDLVIRPEFVEIVRRLSSGCASSITSGVLADSISARLQGGTAAASRNSFEAMPSQRSPFTTVLLVVGALLLIAEHFARRTRRAQVQPGAIEISRAAA